jgi:two-component system, OmpR family, alkaline phosphatase synthesis response regulator PhoP
MKPRILIIEDEPGLRLTLADRLRAESYEVDSEADGGSGFVRASTGEFDAIILDIMLPTMSGFEVCRRLRERGHNVPVLMLSARDQVVDKVAGLQFGADDYVSKPFEFAELLARIQALLRRASPAASTGPFRFGSVEVDFRRTEVLRGGKPVALSAREFHLLQFLIENRGATIPRERLLSEVWGYDSATATRTLDVHIGWLRQKLEDSPKNPVFILTIRGFGYRFNA